jgi:hypothetical protein
MKGYIKVAIYKDGVRYFCRTDKNLFFTEISDVDEAEDKLISMGVEYKDIQQIAEFKNTYK